MQLDAKLLNSKLYLTSMFISNNKRALREIIKLIAKGADVNAKDIDNRTLLMHAAMNNPIRTVKLLLEHNADISVKDNEGNISLLWARLRGREELERIILDNSLAS